MLSRNQFGFRHGKSSEDAVLELSDTVCLYWRGISKPFLYPYFLLQFKMY